MAKVAPLRECPSIVVVSIAIRSPSSHLGATHNCCSVVFVAIFERFPSHILFQGGRYTVPSVNNSLRKEVSPGLKPVCFRPQIERVHLEWLCLSLSLI